MNTAIFTRYVNNALLTTMLAALASCAVDAAPASSAPRERAHPALAADLSPACERCNGPGCEELDAACSGEPEGLPGAFGLMCDPGAPQGEHDFDAPDHAHGDRIVHCRCLEPECSL
jgi:hypothetical protein